MKNKIIKLFTLIIIVIVSISCGEITGPKGPKAGGGRGPYILTPSAEELAKSWSDTTKVKYYTTNWLNTFTNQKIIGAVGKPNDIRYSDENGHYHYPDGVIHGEFKYATNVTRKSGKNYIGALYFDPTRKGQDSAWMIWHVEENGDLHNGSGWGSGAKDDTPPTEEKWKEIYSKWDSSKMGQIKLE